MFEEAQDQIYILQVRAGSMGVYGKLYDKYLDELYRYVFFKVSDESVAEDITSETFIKVLDYIVSSSVRIKNVRALFYRVARNLVIDFYRSKHQTIEHVDLDDVEDMIPSPDHNIEQMIDISISLEHVQQVLTKIKDEYRDVLIMRFVNDMSIDDIAQALDKSPGTVRVLIHRAKQSLQNHISKK